jgi:Flp pilus assembly pilin Flp
MFRKLIKNKKAQNTAEYAILISLVVAGIIAMQTYAQRALQARVRDAGQYLQLQTSDLGTTVQYEPYYLTTNYTVIRNEEETQILDNVTTNQLTNSLRTREKGGFQESTYDDPALPKGI